MSKYKDVSPGGGMRKADLLPESPVPCEFKRGDTVTFTNCNEVRFEGCRVIGFSEPTEWGRFIHLDSSDWWFPRKPEELEKEAAPEDAVKEATDRIQI